MTGTPKQHPREPGHTYEVEWTTISYRTIAFFIFLGILLVGFIIYLIAPHYVAAKIDAAIDALASSRSLQQEGSRKHDAHFLNIDGTVRVKKAQTQQWIRADYNTSLEQGDFIQTSGDGVARIMFTDGTNYVLKPDSLIVERES